MKGFGFRKSDEVVKTAEKGKPMSRARWLSVAFLVPMVLSGCVSTSTLTMTREKPVVDRSVVSPKLEKNRYEKIMVIPPSGTSRGAFEPQIVLFEREFLRRGITVISGAITGKVVLEAPGGDDEKKSEAAALLTDLERALIMAKRTGADAILQVGDFSLSQEVVKTRFFVVDATGGTFREVPQEEYEAFQGFQKQWFASKEMRFIGRLVDVENGEVVATLDVSIPLNHLLPGDYVATFSWDVIRDPAWMQDSENFPYSGNWDSKARKLAEERIIETVVRQLSPQ